MELSPFLGHGELFSVPHVRKTAEKTFLDSVRNINLSYGTKTKRRRRTRSWPPSESNASFHCFKQTTENRWEKTGPYWLRCGRNRPLSWRKRFLMFSDGINQDWENSSKDSSCRAQVRRQIDFAKGVDKKIKYLLQFYSYLLITTRSNNRFEFRRNPRFSFQRARPEIAARGAAPRSASLAMRSQSLNPYH